MIGKLTGTIDSFDDISMIIDVSGVGYVVRASQRTLSTLGICGDVVSILIETQVREDSITLFGFKDQAERFWFRLLTTVQGVGAKAALSILNVCKSEELTMIIAGQDKGSLTRADGVGPKLATRILTELKDKVGALSVQNGVGVTQVETVSVGADTVQNDAVSALVNLGYARGDAYGTVMRLASENDNFDVQDLIASALKELSS